MSRLYLSPGWPWFVKDDQLYFGRQHVGRAELSTFQPLSDLWGRDAHQVYCAGSAIRNADVSTFRVLNRLYAKDSRMVYTIKGPIPEADVSTFEAIGPTEHAFNTTNGYAKDSRHVYHTIIGGKACIVNNGDAASFAACGNGYGRDNVAVYFERKKIPGADPAIWQHLRGPHSCSGNKGYILGQRIRGADGSRLESLPILELSDYWSRDGKSYYQWDQPSDPDIYLKKFRQCFIFLGKVAEVSLTWNRTEPLDPKHSNSWILADHAWISVECKEWLQKPELEIAELPKIGEAFKFGEALHLKLLSTLSWMNEDLIWIFSPSQDHKRLEKRFVLTRSSMVWWEYSSMKQLEFTKNLIALASSL